ncbi:MAG: hypothetical protein ACK4YQ_06190 [Phenylobacterium sp.]|uniref:hypothetical protein n=1 Tax=Phenylobacterium sp. TaxID=1871053 RepID=UPI00391C9827
MDREIDDVAAILPPLLQALDALEFVARHMNPYDPAEALGAVGRPHEPLRVLLPRLADWPQALAGAGRALATACEETLAAFDELDAAAAQAGDFRLIFRALRHGPRAQEALFPLADGLKPVSRFFLEPGRRDDEDLIARLAGAEPRDDTGLAHVGEAPGGRGGFSIYVPETYAPHAPAPLVMALHGGAGNGRGFLWSWLREARTHGAILVCPTAVGETWALQGTDHDTPNLSRILEFVHSRWALDPRRLLLTGMSDGGTFSYVSGLEAESPFTHLAPVSAAFHPMLAQMADPERVRGLPVHIVHGALDWMFPVDMAREASAAMQAAGARVTYREVADLSHTYPRELNPEILAWLGGA